MLTTITQSEQEAQQHIDEARGEAERIVAEARRKAGIELEQHEETLKAERQKQIEIQKQFLKQRYRDIMTEGETEATQIKNKAEKNRSKAVETVVKAIAQQK